MGDQHGAETGIARPRRYRRRPANAKIIEALRECGGVLASTSRRLDVHRQQLHVWISEDEELQRARIEAQELLLDQAEDAVVAAVRAGDLRSSFFLLRTLGQNRGFRAGLSVNTDGGIKQVLANLSETDLKL